MPDSRTCRVLILALDNMRCCIGITGSNPDTSAVINDYPSECDRKIIADSPILHMDGFFIYCNEDMAFDVIRSIMPLSSPSSSDVDDGDHRCFSFNLGATFLIERNPGLSMTFAKICDVLFANRDEFNTLIKLNSSQQQSDDDEEESTFVESMLDFHRIMSGRTNSSDDKIYKRDDGKNNLRKWGKIIVITDGCNPVHCVYGDGQLCTREVVRLADDAIVDTTGAGDAFIAGFLYGLVHDFDIVTCLSVACKTAVEIIRYPGVFIPDEDPRKIIFAH